MFFNSCKKSKDQEGSSVGGTKQGRHSSSNSLKKTFLKVLTRLSFILCCRCKSSENYEKDVNSPPSFVEITPTKRILEANKKQAKAFKDDKKWSTDKVLGAGAFGKVFLIRNETNNELVAKKIVTLNPNDESCMDEAIIHFQLKQVNIINLYCWERLDDQLTLFMEYCSGGDIKANIDRIKGKEALNYFSQLMEGVAYLHSRGVAHRDLKPENLLLNEEKVLKIADLGLAKVFVVNGEEVQLTGTVGSRAFMAPEVIKCSSYIGPPVDLWSCGVIYINLTTKGRPWEQADPENKSYKMWVDKNEELNTLLPWTWLSESCRTIVDILLEPDPVKRVSGWQKHRQG
ncbi:serine/threonine-protein kinase Chk1-like [Oratosquilla oratoria]|uniref:serine/threonine-protein kinase Chk1-like n=1 Tax=Oratosquilla oratoria TaxID=337810 RepID=UPI003F77473B